MQYIHFYYYPSLGILFQAFYLASYMVIRDSLVAAVGWVREGISGNVEFARLILKLYFKLSQCQAPSHQLSGLWG